MISPFPSLLWLWQSLRGGHVSTYLSVHLLFFALLPGLCRDSWTHIVINYAKFIGAVCCLFVCFVFIWIRFWLFLRGPLPVSIQQGWWGFISANQPLEQACSVFYTWHWADVKPSKILYTWIMQNCDGGISILMGGARRCAAAGRGVSLEEITCWTHNHSPGNTAPAPPTRQTARLSENGWQRSALHKEAELITWRSNSST